MRFFFKKLDYTYAVCYLFLGYKLTKPFAGTREDNACYPICCAVFVWSLLIGYIIRPLPYMRYIKDQDVRAYVYGAIGIVELLITFTFLTNRYVKSGMYLKLYEENKGMTKKKRVISVFYIFSLS